MLEIRGKVDPNDIAYVQRLGINPTAGMPCPIDEETGKINPHVTRFLNEEGSKVSVFHVKPIYYETLDGKWRPMSEVTTYHGNHRLDLIEDWDQYMHPRYLAWLLKRMELIGGTIKIPSPFKVEELVPLRRKDILFTTTTVYPDPHTETTTVDGYVGQHSSGSSWATNHDLTSGDDTSDSGTTSPHLCDAAGGVRRLTRGFYLFDTSSIGSGDNISASTFSKAFHSLSGTGHNDTSQVFGLVQTTPASNTAIAAADFDNVTVHEDTVGGATVAVNFSTSAGTYFDFAMTYVGVAWVSKTGVTKLGIRRDPDYSDTTSHSNDPSGVTQSHRNFRTADYTGTSSDPKLVVTHATAASDVSGDASLSTSLTSYWELEEASGTRVDSHGSNDLTDNNTVGQGTGIQGNCVDNEFTNSEYLSLASQPFNYTTGSVSVWVKGEQWHTADGIMSTTKNTSANGFELRVANTTEVANFYFGGGANLVAGTTKLLTGTWYLLTATWTTAGKKIYVNGVLEGTNSTSETLTAGQTTFVLGASIFSGSASRYFDGLLDEAIIWNKELTAAEVANLYNAGAGIPYSSSTAFTETVTEAVDVTDTNTPTYGGVNTQSESISLSDSVSFLQGFVTTLTESITLADVVTAAQSFFTTISESITLSDTATIFEGKIISVTESITLSDTVSLASTFGLAQNESISLSDALIAGLALTESVTESVTLSDTVSSVLGFARTISESVTLSDSATIQFTATETISESVTLSDTVTSLKGLLVEVTESITLSDTATVILTLGVTITETISLVEDYIKAGWSWVLKNGSPSDWTYIDKNSP